MRIIKLKNGTEAIVDDDDYEKLTKRKDGKIRKWRPDIDGYAIGKIDDKNVRMHRYIINAKKGEKVDHIDRQILNNSKSNLRIVTNYQNNQNRSKNKKSSSIYKGVSYRNGRKYESNIMFEHVPKYLGTFKSEIAAAYAYNKEAIKLSEYFHLNEFDLTIKELEEIYIRDIVKMKKAEKQSKHKGICWNKNEKKWTVQLTICSKRKSFGSFKTEEEAYKRLLEVKKEYNI